MNGSPLKKGLICGGICLAAVAALCLFVFLPPSGNKNRKERRADRPETVREQPGQTEQPALSGNNMAFTAAAYQVPANQDTDMNQYLDRQGLAESDVIWSSDSDQAQIGSQGHLVITDYGVSATLTAASKSDENVKASCQVSTRTEQDDLSYQVQSLNGREEAESSPDPASGQPEVVRLNETQQNTGISFQKKKYAPARRNKSYQWDRSLFYSLEDISMESDKDGKINNYEVERKKFSNLDTGNEMEYEIYRNPSTNKVNKIISIEYKEDELEIISYYFTDNGKINFIFKEQDTNYVPDYASPDRNGERFYFKKDVLVNWRVVDNEAKKTIVSYPVGKKEYDRLKKAGTDQMLTLYDKCSSDRKKKFDQKEKEMLNRAYMTFDKVTTSEGISTIYGYVYDDANKPVPNVDVGLKSENYDKELCAFKTDGEGRYAINVPSREMSYTLCFSGDGFRSQSMYGVSMDETQTNTYGETMYMVKEDAESYPNTLLFYDAAVKYSANQMMPIDSGELNIREGINNKTGDIVLTAQFEDGRAEVELPAGMYTVEVNSSEYTHTFGHIFVSPSGDNTHEIYSSGQLRSDEIRIVLTWGASPSDLDSHLFLPYDGSAGQGAAGSAYHIAYYNKQIADGSAVLDVDQTAGYGPETITVSRLKKGYYKYYVTDFKACCDGHYKSTEMSHSSATVRVYNKNGLARSFYVPVNRKGVIWEVFEIRNGVIVPVQRYYDNVDGKTWYKEGK